MAVEFLNDGREAVLRPGNGNAINYRRHYGIYYHTDTPTEIVESLDAARKGRTRIRLHYGDTTTGRDWLEEHDVEGYLGSSMGPLKVPLLLHNSRSTGGQAILDHCIVKIKDTRTGRLLYRHPNYHHGTFIISAIAEGDGSLREDGYTHAVDVDGERHANFRSLQAAERYVRRMTE